MPSEPPGDPAEGPSVDEPTDPPGEPPPDPAAAWPMWKLIRNELARAILRRVFRPEARLPGIRALRQEYGCGALSVQTAVRELQTEGFVAPSTSGSPWRVAVSPPRQWPAAWESPPPGWL